jgi:hypothetical protein
LTPEEAIIKDALVLPLKATPFFFQTYVGVGLPVATTEKVTDWLMKSVCESGCVIIDGAKLTVKVTAWLVIVPALLAMVTV